MTRSRSRRQTDRTQQTRTGAERSSWPRLGRHAFIASWPTESPLHPVHACPPATTATAWIERRAPWARGSTSRRGSNQAGSHSRSVPTRPEERGAIRPIRAVLPPTPAYWPGRFGFDAGHSRTDGFRIRPTRLIERRLKSPLLPAWIEERCFILELEFCKLRRDCVKSRVRWIIPEDHPGRGRARVRTNHRHRMTIRNVDARPNRLFCGISRGIGTQSVVTTIL